MHLILLIFIFGLSSCISPLEKGSVDINIKSVINSKSKPTISNVILENDQLKISGTNFNNLKTVKIDSQILSVLSNSGNDLILSAPSAVTLALNTMLNLVVETANGATSVAVTFNLVDGSVTASKIGDGEIGANHLSSMGAGSGQVMQWNGTAWTPADLSGLSFLGGWDASGAAPSATIAGEYYIVSTAGTTNLSGITSWTVGDWAVFDGSNWAKIDNSTGVKTFNGRSGIVTAQSNDYSWNQIDKTVSSINDIADVDTTGVTVNDVLKWDGSKWIVAADETVTAGSVTSSAIADGTIQSVDLNASLNTTLSQVGTNSSNITTNTSDIATNASDIAANATNIATNTSNIAANTTSLSSKVDKTTTVNGQALSSNVTLTTSNIAEGTNLYYTSARAKADTILNTTAGSETDQGPSVAAMKSYVLAQTGAISSSQWTTSVSDIYYNSGNVGVGTSAPTNSFHVSSANTSAARIHSSTTSSQLRFSNSGTGVMPGLGSSNDDFIIHTNGAERVRILSNGNVGIGNITPGSKLDVSGSIRAPEICDETGANCKDISTGWGFTGVTSVGASAPLASSGGTTPTISISQATTTTNGYLSSTDWNTFNTKQAAITTGTTAQYLRGDLSLGVFASDVASSILSGFITGANSTVLNTDTVETSIEKLQGQINATNTTVGGKENSITAGTTAQYWRGDKSWQTLDKSAVGLSNVTNDAQLPLANRDNGALSTSTTNVPTSNAVKSYVDSATSAITSSQWTTAGSDIYYNAGKVGIGTAAPVSTLEVVNDSLSLPAPGSDGSSIHTQSRFNLSPSANYTVAAGGYQFAYGQNNVYEISSATTATDLSRLYLSGHVTSAIYSAAAPTTQIMGAVSNARFNSTSTASLTVGGSFKSQNVSSGTITMAQGLSSVVNNAGTGSITDAISLTANVFNTNVGGTISNAYGIKIMDFSNNGTITNAYGLHIGTLSGTSKYSLYASDVASPSYFAGNVGIGTTTPTEKLHVSGNVIATAYLYTSDMRFKTNILTVTNSLDKISKLRGVTFDWKTQEFPERNFPQETTYGFIAQEVEEVVPELVKTSEDGYKSVHYANLTSLLVEGIKELQKKISSLFSNDEKLKREVASLKEENELLKSQMKDVQEDLKKMREEFLKDRK